MNVHELIKQLEKIKNKNLPVVISSDGCNGGEYNIISVLERSDSLDPYAPYEGKSHVLLNDKDYVNE